SEPAVFGRSMILRSYCRETACLMGITNSWQLDMAAMLMRIGQTAMPTETAAKLSTGAPLKRDEAELVERIPEIGASLLRRIPRLQPVSEIILYQNKHFDGSGFPHDDRVGTDIPVESRLLRILDDLVELESAGTQRAVAVRLVRSRKGRYDDGM